MHAPTLGTETKTINTISQSVCNLDGEEGVITMNMQDCLDINLGLQDGLYIMIEVVTAINKCFPSKKKWLNKFFDLCASAF